MNCLRADRIRFFGEEFKNLNDFPTDRRIFIKRLYTSVEHEQVGNDFV